MIVLGIALFAVGVFLGLVSAAGFDEARKRTREFGLPTAVLVVALVLVIWGGSIVNAS